MQTIKEGKDYYLRIFIDKPEGITIDDCEKVNDAIKDKLDEEDYIKQQYFLEVSSPGAEKPLKTLEKVQQSIGEYVYIQFKNPTQGMNEVYGTILNVEGV